MRLGLFFGPRPEGWDIAGHIEQTVQAERDGFDSVWFAQVAIADVLTVIALAGQQTSSIELGTAVVPIYTRHPNVMAQQAQTTNVAAGGRLSLGVGVSHAPAVERLGFSYNAPAKRMREYLQVLRPLIDTGSVDFQGEVYQVSASFQIPGARPMPVLISALAPVMLKTAGQLADGTITWMAGPRSIEQHVGPLIRKAAAEAGRPEPRIVAGLPVAVCDNPDQGRQAASRLYERYGNLENYRRVMDREGEGLGPEDIAVCGAETEVEQRLRQLASAGTTDFIASIFPVGPDEEASIARTRSLLARLSGKL